MNPPKERQVPASVHPILAVPREFAVTGRTQEMINLLIPLSQPGWTPLIYFFLPMSSVGAETDWDWQLNTNWFTREKEKNPNQPTNVF